MNRNWREVLLVCLRLGCASFGGPVAHLGYFHEEFVRRRKWLDESTFADLVALCQFLPGPASSQVVYSIGLRQAGWLGGAAAWIGFTLPSAALMLAFAYGLGFSDGWELGGWIGGLKIAAVAVVANALWTMAAKLCPDAKRAVIAILAASVMILFPMAWMQVAVIVAGALAGRVFLVPDASAATPAGQGTNTGWPWLLAFASLLVGLPILVWATGAPLAFLIESFYRSGSLVFGGGHVVLPLLEEATVGRGWLDRDTFLAGYGFVQAMPGPLFTFAAYLGSVINVGPGGVGGGLLALVAIYLPSWLLLPGAMPYWNRLRALPSARSSMMGTNAAVVGLLGAAFYSPVLISGVAGGPQVVFALLAFGALRFLKLPPWLLVILCAVAGGIVL
ncbi:MAG: chromate efflux transporter [Opitutaceae bacterium]